MSLTFDSSRFGRLEVDADSVIEFPAGLIGLDVWVTVRAASELADFSCNLRAPIVIWKGRGHQVINEAKDAPVRAPLFPESASVQAA